MPVHRVPMDDLEDNVASIEKSERIISLTPAGDGAVIVLTEPKAKRAKPVEVEQR